MTSLWGQSGQFADCTARSRLSDARHEPAQNFLVRIAPKLMIWIATTAMELVLLRCLFSEYHSLFFGLSLVLRKCHPFANDFSARVVVFHVRGSLAYLIWDSGARPRSAWTLGATRPHTQKPTVIAAEGERQKTGMSVMFTLLHRVAAVAGLAVALFATVAWIGVVGYALIKLL